MLIVPELYFNKKTNEKGPDILIIDMMKKVIIAIEVKSKHLKLLSRHNPVNEYIDGLIDTSISAMDRLNKKMKKIFNKVGDYSTYKDAINGCSIIDSYSIVVCADYGYFIDGIIYEKYSREYNHLNKNYVFMDIPALENLLEYTEQNSQSINDNIDQLVKILTHERTDTNVRDIYSQYNYEKALWNNLEKF